MMLCLATGLEIVLCRLCYIITLYLDSEDFGDNIMIMIIYLRVTFDSYLDTRFVLESISLTYQLSAVVALLSRISNRTNERRRRARL